MDHIKSTSPSVASLLRDLLASLVDSGAWLNPDLVIACSSGGLSMQSARVRTDRRNYIRIPLSCMPLRRDFEVTLDAEGRFQATAVRDDLPANHAAIMDLMLAVYNETGKPGWWQTAYPLLALNEYPRVREHLVRSKMHMPKLQSHMRLLDAGEIDKLVVESFLGARVFNLNPKFLQELGYDESEHGQQVIMPLIDYFNHRFQAEGYTVQATPSPASMRVFGIPDESGELFVRYNLYDPVDTLLFYGFVDTNSPWLASIPGTLTLPDGRSLEIMNIGGSVKKDLPPALRDLRMYMPMIIKNDQEGVKLSKLLIPGPQAPRALQRILGFLVHHLCPTLSQQERLVWVERLESELLDFNTTWWQELQTLCKTIPDDLPIAASMHLLCSDCLQRIHTYETNRPKIS